MRYFWAGCPVDANFSKPPKNSQQRKINCFRQWNTFLIGKTRVHPLTGNDLKDHADYASGMGEPQTFFLDVLRA